jgi:hypothetical protein
MITFGKEPKSSTGSCTQKLHSGSRRQAHDFRCVSCSSSEHNLLSLNRPCLPIPIQLMCIVSLGTADLHKLKQVGGPATNSPEAWLSDFVDYCRNNSVPFDFISTHAVRESDSDANCVSS